MLFHGGDPVYNHPVGKEIEKAIENLEFSVSFSCRKDEIGAACHWACSEPHYF